ncbi:MAG: putative molybdenum carrier protein [Pseudomonadota bacterium]
MIQKIISGGQTGADRAALDFAIKHDIPHGGWLPKGRKTENGTLPEKYQLQEMPTPDYSKRTEKNVLDSDGTLIVAHGFLTGGSALTEFLAEEHKKPYLHIDLGLLTVQEAAQNVNKWLQSHELRVLNVAGPRGRKDPKIYQATMNLLEQTFFADEAEPK